VEVALDPHGDPRKLSESQLKSVRQSGEFVVNSIHFPGQTHVWRLSELLQKGTTRAVETLLVDLSVALRLIISTGQFHNQVDNAKNNIYDYH
jgi:hypothetical protein